MFYHKVWLLLYIKLFRITIDLLFKFSIQIIFVICQKDKNFINIPTFSIDVKSNTNPFPYGKLANSMWMIVAYIA